MWISVRRSSQLLGLKAHHLCGQNGVHEIPGFRRILVDLELGQIGVLNVQNIINGGFGHEDALAVKILLRRVGRLYAVILNEDLDSLLLIYVDSLIYFIVILLLFYCYLLLFIVINVEYCIC